MPAASHDDRDKHGLLLLEEAAYLARVSTSTIRHWVATKKLIGTVRVGKRRLVPRRILAALLQVEPEDLT